MWRTYGEKKHGLINEMFEYMDKMANRHGMGIKGSQNYGTSTRRRVGIWRF